MINQFTQFKFAPAVVSQADCLIVPSTCSYATSEEREEEEVQEDITEEAPRTARDREGGEETTEDGQ